jgi:hypothetical protein
MRVISKTTWVFGLLTLLFGCLAIYCQWRTGCGPSWLPKAHAQDAAAVGFMPDSCQVWRELPLLDKFAALGVFGFGVAFIFSLAMDVGALLRWKRVARLRG